jgi:type II secretion system protein G
MTPERKGFTLIELLIVVAIIGILAALLIPNAISAIQKSKQKQTMKDIVTIAEASVDYATDHGEAPALGSQSGELVNNCAFIQALVPTYLKACPVYDQWNNALMVYTGNSAAGVYGLPDGEVAEDDVLVSSTGRKGEDDGWTYNTADSASGLYEIHSALSYEHDLINLNGTWLRGPRPGVEGNSTGTGT